MKKILIINLTRMGDLLQTTPLIEGLKEKFEDCKISLLVNTRFSEICKGIPFIDELIEFDMRNLRDMIREKVSPVECYKVIDYLIERINSSNYDIAINLTHSPFSAILISMVNAREVYGFTIDSEGMRMIQHPWLQYLFNVVPNRDYNPFHLVDIYLKAGGVSSVSRKLLFYPDSDDMEYVSKIIEDNGIQKGDLLIGIQPGASKEDRRWPVENFAKTMDILSELYRPKFIVFGSKEETDLVNHLLMMTSADCINMAGKTTLGQLGAFLSKCNLLIGNDTGTLHLATAVGTKVIGLFLVNAHYMETGPYGEGHYVIEPDISCMPCNFDVNCKERICKDKITPEAVVSICREVIEGKRIVYTDEKWNELQVYRSSFDKKGNLVYSPIIKRPLEIKHLFRIIYRHVWTNSLEEFSRNIDQIYQEIREEVNKGYLIIDHSAVLEALKRKAEIAKKIKRLAEECYILVEEIHDLATSNSPDIKRIKDIWSKVEKIEKDIDVKGHIESSFRPIIMIFKYGLESLQGNELHEIAESAVGVYRDLYHNISKMLLILEKILESGIFKIQQEPEKKEKVLWYM